MLSRFCIVVVLLAPSCDGESDGQSDVDPVVAPDCLAQARHCSSGDYGTDLDNKTRECIALSKAYNKKWPWNGDMGPPVCYEREVPYCTAIQIMWQSQFAVGGTDGRERAFDECREHIARSDRCWHETRDGNGALVRGELLRAEFCK
jgi:hypothetical protein